MLGKAIKHEFRATARVFLPMFAAIILISLIAGVFYTHGLDTVPNTIVLMLLVMVFTAVWIVTVALLLRRFWNNILGREGYLMNVLPVSAYQHIFAKCLTAAVWLILGVIVSTLGILTVVFLAGVLNADFELFRKELWRVLGQVIPMLRQEELLGSAVLFAVQTLLAAISGTVFTVLHVYLAMALGQMSNKHRIWLSIGAYIGISLLMSTVSTALNTDIATTIIFNDFNTVSGYFTIMNKVLLYGNIQNIFYVLLFFFCTGFILDKKLNLQ